MEINELLFNLDRVVEFNGTVYRVVLILDNDLLLVVNKHNLDQGKFPLQPVIIPDMK